MKTICCFVIFCVNIVNFALSFTEQNRMITREEYIEMWYKIAVEQMIEYKIPASITLAQGILESGHGNSDLARLANNHFGIKCHEWTGETIFHDDDKPGECFRKYSSAEQSYIDHSIFLTSRKRYNKLFSLDINDYKQWAHGLKSAGYATSPKYATALIELIETYKLYEFDKMTSPLITQPDRLIVTINRTSESTKPITTKQTQNIEVNISTKRETQLHENKTKYVLAQKGDTYKKIAQEYGLTLRQILKYNDVNDEYTFLKKGDIVMIHPKKSKGSVHSRSYDQDLTIREISQMEGVKLEKIMELNSLTSASQNYVVKKGEIVLLR